MLRRALLLSVGAASCAPLPPLAWAPLPHGTLAPEGWLARQLKIQGDGMAGHFQTFWGPMANSTWTGGSNKEGDWVEIWPYVLQGFVPQAILLRDPAQLAQTQTWLDYLLEQQAASGTGWLGPPPAARDGGMLYWPQWPIVLSFLAWREYGIAVNGTEDPRLLAGALAWLHNASGMLEERPMGRDWSGTRWQDFIYAIQAVQDCPATPPAEQPFLQALAATVYAQGTTRGIDWAAFYTPENFPKAAVPAWDYLPHGVNNALAVKGGAIAWRAGLEPLGNASSWQRDALLMQYHGSPSGVFLADECLAGRMPSKGSETCLVVEQLFSLNLVHEVQGDAFFAERAETIAYNALPAIGTKDLWSRVYLQQPNEVFAGHSAPHVWNTDGDDANTYSLQENYECCTANFNQGWPRFIQHMLHATPDGGVAVSILGPVSATLASGVAVNVSGEYPFEDTITVTLSHLPPGPLTLPLYLRIPSWATAATLSINGATPPTPAGASNGTMLRIPWPPGAAGPTATVTLATNPAIRAAQWEGGALALSRGALLYALRLDENFAVTGRAALEPRAADYTVSQPGCALRPSQPNCSAPWNVALVTGEAGAPPPDAVFTRTGSVPAVPFAAGPWGASNLEITASVRAVGGWGLASNAAAPPPPSPVDCADPAAACGEVYTATLVPYGATHLRMAELPWTAPPPCLAPAGYDPSGATALSGGAGDFLLSGGASLVPNGDRVDLRSGEPGGVALAAYGALVTDAAHAVTGLALGYQYVAGYGGDGAPGGAVVEVVALAPGPCASGGTGGVLATLYTSPPLEHYPYDVCASCYSPLVNVSLPAGSFSLNASAGVVLALRVSNNARNVQLRLPLPARVFWGGGNATAGA